MGPRSVEKARNPRSTLRRLAAYLRPFTLQIALVLVLTVVGTLLGLAGPYLMGVAIDRYIGGSDLDGLLRVSLWMFTVYAGSSIAQVGQGWIMARVAQNALKDLRRTLFTHVQTLPLKYFDTHPQGDLMSRLTNDIGAIQMALTMNVTQMIVSLLTVVGILVIMFSMNVWLALGVLTVFPLMVLLTASVAKQTRSGFRALQANLGQLNGHMEETISGVRVIQAFGQQGSTIEAFDRSNAAVREAGIRAQVYALLVPPMMGVLSQVNLAVVAGLGGYLALRGLVSVGVIAAFITYARRFVEPLRQMGELYNTVQAALAGAERVFETMDEQSEVSDVSDAPVISNVAGHVDFDQVSFGYVPGTPVLKDIQMSVAPGQRVALVGPTGAGKTTIISLLTRFYDVDQGAIRLDGRDIREVNRASLRRAMGVVLQDTFLFSDTVMENIRYGRLDASDEEVMAAAKLADADGFIRRLPAGYQTRLSERASNLSQGQRQLLAIARAILSDPRVLVLDEATSNIDTRTEVRIQRALLRLMEGRTTFVIAHRLSTIRQADRILVINDGRIIERGTHGELMSQKGFYHNLYMAQFKGRLPPQREALDGAKVAVGSPGQ